MMNYEMFKEQVSMQLETFLPDAHRDRKIDLATINGLNGPRDVMCFLVGSKDEPISPKVYLDELYEEYKEVQDLNAILYCTARDMCSALEEGREYRRIIAEDDLEENVTFQLVNTAKNEDYLKQVPHREYHDLSVIYRVIHKLESGNVLGYPVTNAISKRKGISEDRLYDLAYANTDRIMPTSIKPMSLFVKGKHSGINLPFDLSKSAKDMGTDSLLYVVTNEWNLNGATAILYEEHLQELAKHLGTDFYLVPASRHEVIAVSVERITPEMLLDMKNQIIENVSQMKEALSDQVYYYDSTARQVKLGAEYQTKTHNPERQEPERKHEKKAPSR